MTELEENRPDHSAQHRQIQALFEGKLSPKEHETLFAHLRECRACQKAYDKWAALESSMHQVPSNRVLNASQRDRISDRLFQPSQPIKQSSKKPLFSGLVAAAAVAFAAVLFVSPPKEAGFQPRSGDSIQDKQNVSLRVLRIRSTDQNEPKVSDLGQVQQSLARNDKLIILYSNFEHYKYVHVVATTADGIDHVLIPVTKIEENTQDAQLGGVLSPTGTWPSGDLTFTAVFSKAEIDRESNSIDTGSNSTLIVKRTVQTQFVGGERR